MCTSISVSPASNLTSTLGGPAFSISTYHPWSGVAEVSRAPVVGDQRTTTVPPGTEIARVSSAAVAVVVVVVVVVAPVVAAPPAAVVTVVVVATVLGVRHRRSRDRI